MSSKIPFGFKYQVMEARHNTPTGDKIQMEHNAKIGLDGKRELTWDKPVNIYEIIQASREQTEIERIVKRALEGDPTALQAVTGQYADITGAPKSLAHAQQIIIDAKNQFDKLDPERKKLFNNNAEEFVAQVGTNEWYDKMGITDKINHEKQKKANQAEFQKNLEAAMKNLAGQSAITNMEVKANE